MWTRAMSWGLAALVAVVTVLSPSTVSATAPLKETTESAARQSLSLAEGAIRLSGPNRYATSAVLAESWPVGTKTAFLASGQTFPDALTAASRAGVENAPLLLTRAANLPDETVTALRRLRPQRIVVVGGTSEVSAAVVRELKDYAASGTVLRVGGDTAYATSLAVSRLYPTGVGRAYLASGEDFPDALAGAALAGHQGLPLLLTRNDRLDSAAGDELARLNPAEIIVLGGPAALSDEVVRAAAPFSGAPIRRIAGADRYRTAAAVAAEFPPTSGAAYVASGENFPDALVGAAAAATQGAPVLLTPAHQVHSATSQAITRAEVPTAYVLGGTAVIYSSTMTRLASYLLSPDRAERFTPLRDQLDFDWSGHQWSAKESSSQGPGPNRWHRSGVELGDRGSLKLRVQKNSTGQWQCAEVVRVGPTGYGTFSFSTTSSVLPPNERTVLGMFSYQHLSPDQGHEEIDIEYARWGKSGTGPGSISLHKPDPPWTREFGLLYTGPMTHSFLWAPGYVQWKIVRDDTGAVLHRREFWGAGVPKYADARMRMNLWLMDGVAASQQEPFEVTFSSAKWTPLPSGFTAPPVTTSDPATANVVDSFDSRLQTSLWPGQYQYGSPTVTQGGLQIPLGPGFHGVQSYKEYRLAGSSISVEQTRPRDVHAQSQSEVAFKRDEQNSVSLITVGVNTGRARIRTGGVTRSADFTYDRVKHRWLRIRQSGTRVYFEASPDGRTWSAVTQSLSSPAWVMDGLGQIKLGGGNHEVDDPAGNVRFDNLNRPG